MKKWLGYLLFGLSSYLLFLVITLPAAHLYHHFKEQLPGLSLSSLSGTIWQGSAKQANINRLELSPLYWSFNPLPLFLGRVEFQVSTTGAKLRATGNIGSTIAGTPYLSQLKGDTGIDTILALIPPLPVRPSGRIQFDLEQVEFSDRRLSHISGVIDWKSAGVTQPLKIQIGNLSMTLDTDDEGIHGIITDSGASVGINGRLDLQPDGRYQLKGKIQPKPTTPRDLLNTLNMIGQPDASGAVTLSTSGKIQMGGTM